jgi:predicted metal-dependent phosphotriesterase family hydrolase
MGKNPFNTILDGVPILKATGLTEQDFYKLFTENPYACLTLDRKFFG